MQYIFTDPGQLKVGTTLLPGIFESLEITAAVKMDEVEIKGKQEKVTQAVGYDPARVRLSLILLPQADGGDCTDQIQSIQQIFRASPSQAKPGVYRIVNQHCLARGINEVIFSDLRTYEDNKSDKILATVEFTEHVAITVKVATQAKKAATSTNKTTTSKTASKPAATAAGNTFAELRRLDTKISAKTQQTPAKDTKEPSVGKKLIAWLRGKDIG